MKHKKMITVLTFLIGVVVLHAQEVVPASGGQATGIGGTVSYSVGQVVYNDQTGTNGTELQGVQQPYEIMVSLGVKEHNFNLELLVFPNPAINSVNIKFNKNMVDRMSYQLYDMQGRLLKKQKLTALNTLLKLEHLPSATYFIRVMNNQKTVKTFKIIKSN